MARKRGRGVSLGTVTVLTLTCLTLLAGGVIFSRVSGGMGPISIDAKLIAEPLTLLTRNAANATPNAGSAPGDPPSAAAPAPTSAPTPTPAPTLPPVRTLTLTAVGQVTIGSELRAAAQNGAAYSFDSMFAPVGSMLAGANLSIATLRTGLTDDAALYDTYAAPSALVTGLRSVGVNLFNLTTDRLFDGGVQGALSTRTVMEGLGASLAGIYRTPEERQGLSVIDLGGIKVGLLAYTQNISAAGKKAATDAEMFAVTRLWNPQTAATDVSSLRAKGAEIIIVLVHWGSRSDTKASRDTRAMADTLAQAGADIILGTGPTSVHELERRMVADGNGDSREVFIAYSLGNFLVDDSRDTEDIVGMILRLSIQWDTVARRASVQQAQYMPTWIMRWRDGQGVNRYRVIPAGSSSLPEGMTDSVYANMQKAYRSVVSRLGEETAQPRAQ